MTTLAELLPTATTASTTATDPVVTAVTTPSPAPTAPNADVVAEAERLMQDAEFNRSILDGIEGDEDLHTDTLKKIASKVGKKTHAQVMAASKKIADQEAEMTKMREDIAAMRKEREDEKAAQESKAKADSNTTQFQKLSTACSGLDMDLETLLADEANKATLQNGYRDEDAPFTYVQEISAYIAKGKYDKAAEVVALAFGKNKPAAVPTTVQPAATSATSTVSDTGPTYDSELSTLTHTYQRGPKTYKETDAYQKASLALKIKYAQ